MSVKRIKKNSKSEKEPKVIDKFEGLVGDRLKEVNEDLLDELIRSGEFFKINIYDHTRLMNSNQKIALFEKVDQLNLIALIIDYKLDSQLVNNWIKTYQFYKIQIRQSNNQLTYRSTTNEQIVLYHYLCKLKLINMDDLIQDSNKKASLLSFLLNRDTDNVRRALRNSNVKDWEKKYYTEKCLDNIILLADEIGFENLKKEAKRDLFRLYKK